MMERREKRNEIEKALRTLGYTELFISDTHTKDIDDDRTEVLIGTKRFGIYDFRKHTFVD